MFSYDYWLTNCMADLSIYSEMLCEVPHHTQNTRASARSHTKLHLIEGLVKNLPVNHEQ